jgi:hypothetical protein
MGDAEQWLLGSAAERVAQQLEAKVWSLRYTQAMALNVQAVVQSVSAVFQERGCSAADSTFSRLRWGCVVLSADSVTDVADLWNARWPLTVAEVRQLLAKRRDFSGSDIARLKLK